MSDRLPSRWHCKTATPSAKVSRCTSPNHRSSLPAPGRPPAIKRTPSQCPPVPRTRPRGLDTVTRRRAGRSGADSRRHPRSGPGARAGFRYPREIAGCGCLRSPPPPGLHYYFYPGCCWLRMVVSTGLVGLPGGWGRREVGHQSTRKKKKFGRATSRVEGQEGAAGWRECAVR